MAKDIAESGAEVSDADVSTRTGMGEPEENAAGTEEAAEGSEETADESGESEESGEAEETEESAEGSGKGSEARQTRESAESGEEESEESDESEEDSEEEESEEEGESDDSTEDKDKNRTVPYSLLKSKNKKIKQLEADLDVARGKREDANATGDRASAEAANAEIEAAAKELGEELGLDTPGIAKILKKAVELSSKKSVLPKEIVDKLKELDKLTAQSRQAEEAAHFGKEWGALNIQKQYPNASPAALKEAQELMDTLAHSKQHHKHDLDYILFKNKAKFDTILKTAGKGKSGETGKRVGRTEEAESEEDEAMVDIENLSPDVMRRREARDTAVVNKSDKVKDYKIIDTKRD